jgi:V/A-type H+/Na+-transporting ATPase subunit K
MDMSMVGPAIVMALGCIGSSIGCALAGMASHGAMMRVDEGHAKFITLSAAPSSQAIFGFILLIRMQSALKTGTLHDMEAIGIGLFVGLAFLISGIFQGRCAVTAIQSAAKQPAIFGKTFIAIGVVESFAIFAFVFALLLI